MIKIAAQDFDYPKKPNNNNIFTYIYIHLILLKCFQACRLYRQRMLNSFKGYAYYSVLQILKKKRVVRFFEKRNAIPLRVLPFLVVPCLGM